MRFKRKCISVDKALAAYNFIVHHDQLFSPKLLISKGRVARGNFCSNLLCNSDDIKVRIALQIVRRGQFFSQLAMIRFIACDKTRYISGFSQIKTKHDVTVARAKQVICFFFSHQILCKVLCLQLVVPALTNFYLSTNTVALLNTLTNVLCHFQSA